MIVIDVRKVESVLLADGWLQVVPGSLVVGPLGYSNGTDQASALAPGFRVQEFDHELGRVSEFSGPLSSIIAVRSRS